jgi:NitT/TauT family transport system substrate-binding protein
VDAAVMIDPAFAQLEARAGDLTVLSDTRTQEGVQEAYGTETYPAAVLYTREGWLEDNTDTAAKLSRAITRALAWIQEHSAEEIADSMPEEYGGDDPSLYATAIENSKPMFSPDGRMDPEGAEAVLSVLRQSDEEVASTDIDLARTFTNDLIDGG